MRIRIQDLQGSAVRTPQISPQSALSVTDPGAQANRAPVPPELLNFAPLSKALQGIAEERREWQQDIDANLGDQLRQRIEDTGEDVDTALKALTENGETPARVRGRLTRMVKEGKIDLSQSPAFRLGFESRSADYDLIQYEKRARAKIEEVGRKVGQVSLDEQNEAINEAMQELSQLGEFNGGFFYQQRLSDKLMEVNSRLMDGVMKTADKYRKERYIFNVGEVVSNALTIAMEAEDDLGKRGAISTISQILNETRLEVGDEKAAEILINAVQTRTQEIVNNEGYEEAAEMVGYIIDYTKGRGKDSLLASTGQELGLHSMLEEYRYRAQREVDRKNQEKGFSLRNTVNGLMSTQFAKDLENAARTGSRDKVREVAEGILREFDSSDKKEWFEANGIPEDLWENFRPALVALERDEMQAADSYGSGDLDAVKDRIFELGFEEMPEGWSALQVAKEIIRTDPAASGKKQELLQMAERMYSDDGPTAKVFGQLTGMGLLSVADTIAAEIQGVDSRDPSFDHFKASTDAAVIQKKIIQDLEQFSEQVTDETSYTDAMTYMSDLQNRLRTEFPSPKIKGITGTDTPEGRATAAAEAPKVQNSYDRAGDLYNTSSDFVLGVIPRANATPALLELEREATRLKSSEGFFGRNPETQRRRRTAMTLATMQDLDADKDVPDSQKRRAKVAAMLTSGMMDTTTFRFALSGDLNTVKGILEATTPLDSVGVGTRDLDGPLLLLDPKTASKTIDDVVNRGFDPLHVNLFSIRMHDMRKTTGWTQATERMGVDGRPIIALNRSAIPEHTLQHMEMILETYGLAVTEDNLIKFVQSQHNNWAR